MPYGSTSAGLFPLLVPGFNPPVRASGFDMSRYDGLEDDFGPQFPAFGQVPDMGMDDQFAGVGPLEPEPEPEMPLFQPATPRFDMRRYDGLEDNLPLAKPLPTQESIDAGYLQRTSNDNWDLVERYQQADREMQRENPVSDKVKYFAKRSVPGFSTGYQIADLEKARVAANKLEVEPLSNEDAYALAKLLNETEDSQKRSGWGKVGDILAELPAFAGELAATAGVGTVARKGMLKLGANLLTKKLARRSLAKAVAKRAVGVAANTAQVAAQTALQPQQVAKNTLARNLRQTLAGNPESLAVSAVHGIGQTALETATEVLAGKAIQSIVGKGKAYLARKLAQKTPALDRVRQRIVEAWAARTNKTLAEGWKKVADQAGWNGMLGELGEERVNEIVLGVAGELGAKGSEYDFGATGNIASGEFGKAAEQLGPEAAAFAIPGATVLSAQGILALRGRKREAVDRFLNDTANGTAYREAVQAGMAPIEDANGNVLPAPSRSQRATYAADIQEAISVLGENNTATQSPTGDSSVASPNATPPLEPKKGGDLDEEEGQRGEVRQITAPPAQLDAGAGVGSAPVSNAPADEVSDEEVARMMAEQWAEDEAEETPETISPRQPLPPLPPDEPRSTGAARLQADQWLRTVPEPRTPAPLPAGPSLESPQPGTASPSPTGDAGSAAAPAFKATPHYGEVRAIAYAHGTDRSPEYLEQLAIAIEGSANPKLAASGFGGLATNDIIFLGKAFDAGFTSDVVAELRATAGRIRADKANSETPEVKAEARAARINQLKQHRQEYSDLLATVPTTKIVNSPYLGEHVVKRSAESIAKEKAAYRKFIQEIDAELAVLEAESNSQREAAPASEPAKQPWQMTRGELERLRQSKSQMIARGADGSLTKAHEVSIPLNKIEGREPVPAMEGGYKKGTPITQPIEVEYKPETDTYILYSGNHRVTQAEINGDKTIRAFVEGLNHKSVVEKALAEGKPVPPAVLADYPDLQPKREAAPASEPAKQPWEMTREEWLSTPEGQLRLQAATKEVRRQEEERYRGKLRKRLTKSEQHSADQHIEKIRSAPLEGFAERQAELIAMGLRSGEGGHYSAIEQAVREGKPVPPSVLADYPDLQPKREAAPSLPAGDQAAAPASRAEADPNIGRSWNSQHGKQTIVRREDMPAGSLYDVETEGTGDIRRYDPARIEEIIRKDEYRLTPQYAEEQRQAEEHRKRLAAEQKQQDEKDAAIKAEIAAFVGKKPAMELARIEKVLRVNVRYRNKFQSRKDMIDLIVSEVGRIEQGSEGRRLMTGDQSFLSEKTTTKIGMDYAAWKIAQKGTPDVPSQTTSPPDQPEAQGGDQPLSLPEQTKQRRKRVKELPAEDQPVAQAVVTTIERAERVAERAAGTEHGAELQEAIAEAKQELDGVLPAETVQTPAQKWQAAQDAYRARTIGDAEYLAARKEWEADQAAFDQSRGEEAPKSEPEPFVRQSPTQGSPEHQELLAQREKLLDKRGELERHKKTNMLPKPRRGSKAASEQYDRNRNLERQLEQNYNDLSRLDRRLREIELDDAAESSASPLQQLAGILERAQNRHKDAIQDRNYGELDRAQTELDDALLKLVEAIKPKVREAAPQFNKDEVDAIAGRIADRLSPLRDNFESSLQAEINRQREARVGYWPGQQWLSDEHTKEFREKFDKIVDSPDWYEQAQVLQKEASQQADADRRKSIEADEERRAEQAKRLNEARAEGERNARKRAKEAAVEVRFWKRLAERAKSLPWKTGTFDVTVTKEGDSPTREGPMIAEFGIHMRKGPKTDRYNKEIPGSEEKTYTLTHLRTGLAVGTYKSEKDAKSLAQFLLDSGIDWSQVKDPSTIDNETRKTYARFVAAFDKEDLSKLEGNERTAALETAAAKATDVNADRVLDATDLGIGTTKEAKIAPKLREFADAVPEFAFDPVFTVEDGKTGPVLAFHDGYDFKFAPEAFNLDQTELEVGQTVGINLPDVGIKPLTVEEMVAKVLRNRSFATTINADGTITAKWKVGGATKTVQVARQGNGRYAIVGSVAEPWQRIAAEALKAIRYRQPGETGENLAALESGERSAPKEVTASFPTETTTTSQNAQPATESKAEKVGESIDGNTLDDINYYRPLIDRDVAKHVTAGKPVVHRQWQAAAYLIQDLNPKAQEVLLGYVKEKYPEAFQYAIDNRKQIGIKLINSFEKVQGDQKPTPAPESPYKADQPSAASQLSLKEYTKSLTGKRVEKTAGQTRLQALEADHFAAVKQAVTDGQEVPWKAIEPHWDALLRAGLEPQLKTKTLADPKAAPEVAQRRFDAAIARKDFRDSLNDISKEIKKIAKGEAPTTGGIPITKELLAAIATATVKGMRAGIKSFQAFIAEMKSEFDEDVLKRMKPKLIAAWNQYRERYDVDEATDADFETGMAASKAEPAPPPAAPPPTGEQKTLGLKNRKVDEYREDRGMGERWTPDDRPTMEAARDMAISSAKSEMEADENWAPGLVAKMLDNPTRGVSSTEMGGLIVWHTKKQVARDAALVKVSDLRQKNADPIAILEAENDLKTASLELEMAQRAGAQAKRTWHQAGFALQAEFNDDLTISEILKKWDIARGGRKLAGEEKAAEEAKATELFKDYQKLKEQFDKLEAEHAKQAEELALTKSHLEALKEAKKGAAIPTTQPTPETTAEPKPKFRRAKEKLDRLKAAYMKFGKSLFGASHSFGSFSKEALQDGIEFVRSAMDLGVATFQDLVELVKEEFNKTLNSDETDGLREVWNAANMQAAKEAVVEAYDPADVTSLQDVARAIHRFVIERDQLGPTPADRDKAVAEVHEVLTEILKEHLGDNFEGWTEQQTRRAMSKYGDSRELPQDYVSVMVREHNAQIQKIEQIADIQLKGFADATGTIRDKPSEWQRELQRQVNEAKKKYGIEPSETDKQRHLQSTLASAKTAVRNRIQDLGKAIQAFEAGKPSPILPRTKTSVTDTELTKLRAERDQLQKAYDAVYGKRELSDAQKLAILEKAVELSNANIKEMLASGKLFPDVKNKPELTSARLEAARAQNELLKETLKDLRRHSPEGIARELAAQEDRLNEAIAETVKSIENDELHPADQPVKPTSDSIEAKKEVLKLLRQRKAELAKNTAEGKLRSDAMYRMRQLQLLAKWAERALTGDYRRPPPPAERKLTPEDLEVRRGIERNRKAVQVEQERIRRAERKTWQKVGETLLDIWNLPRDFGLGGEWSFALLQGMSYFRARPIRWATVAMPAVFKTFFARDASAPFWKQLDAAAADAKLMDYELQITERPNFKNGNYDAMGIAFSQEGGPLSKGEELIISRIPDKLPFLRHVFSRYRAAGRVFLNIMRADMADLTLSLYGNDGATKTEMKAMGAAVNIGSGKGVSGRYGPAISALNQVMTSATWALSRIQEMTGYTMWSPGSTNATRKAVAKIYGRQIATVSAISALASIGSWLLYDDDDEDRLRSEWNPISSDLWSIVGGDTRINLTGGMAAYVTLAFRFFSGKIKNDKGEIESAKGKMYDRDLLAKWWMNRLHPSLATVWDLKRGETIMREPFGPEDLPARVVTPFTYKSIYEAMDKDDVPRSAFFALTGYLGGNLNTYARKVESRQDAATELERLTKQREKFPDRGENLQKRIDATMERHFKSAIEHEVKNALRNDPKHAEKYEKLLKDLPTTNVLKDKLSEDMAAALLKEKRQIALAAVESLKSEDFKPKLRKVNDEWVYGTKSDKGDQSTQAARDLLRKIAPTATDAIQLYNDAKLAKGESLMDGKKPSASALAAYGKIAVIYAGK